MFLVTILLGFSGISFASLVDFSAVEISENFTERQALSDDVSENEVEVLILLKEQADSQKAAEQAEKSQDATMSSREKKTEVRTAVFETLTKTAEEGQASLLNFLENERKEARVSEVQSFYIVNLVYARVSPDLVDTIASRWDVDSVWPNEKIQLVQPEKGTSLLSQESGIQWNIIHIGAPKVWNDFGVDGSGVVVGIIDTGVDWQHEALMEKYRGYTSSNPVNPSHAYNWFDPYYNYSFADDWNGHGTHVAGTVLGSDPEGNSQMGVAPGARWIAARGLDDEGSGSFRELLAAMQFMLAPTSNFDGSGTADPAMAPDIVNNSWGGGAFCLPMFKTAIDNWRNADILPVFAAGNEGPESETVGIPANYKESFAVGAVDSSNELAWFSSIGPGACGDFWKPDIVAPGVDILSAMSWNPVQERGYENWNGTSMAAPHAAGVAALLRSVQPSLSVEQLEKIMRDSAVPLTSDSNPDSPNYAFGYGLIDAYASVGSIEYDITLSVSPEEGGTVSGGGSYPLGSQVTVTAEAHDDFIFLNWTEDEQVVSMDSSYTFTIDGDRHLLANFVSKEYEITLLPNPHQGGTVTGAGIYERGEDVTVTALPNEGYHFVSWTEDGYQVSTHAQFTFEALYNRTLTANFVFGDVPNNVLRIGEDIYDFNSDNYNSQTVLDSIEYGGNVLYFKSFNGLWYNLSDGSVTDTGHLFDESRAVPQSEVESWQLRYWYKAGDEVVTF